MEISTVELRGRMMVLELIVPIALTHIAALAPDPVHFIRTFMANAEDMIGRITAAPTPDEQEIAKHAQAAFDDLSDAMEQHLAQRSRPAGHG